MHAVVVFFIGYSFNLKIANQTISVCSLFVLALLVDKPNTVQTILPAVIADTKSSTNPAFAMSASFDPHERGEPLNVVE
ncbi:MAG TPA: hypothetical protein VK729_11510 [Silvibacterium sp.]|jgi:hypothetical protein|nr:hypothetical protein [Silvibacterium sp.]